MAKILLLGVALSAVAMGDAFAQANNPPPPREQPRQGLIRGGHITSTGQTVPNPGVSQGDGTTPLDRGIEREDDRIQ
ncbi:MAG: hypothetical protein P4L76_07190, partial [Beijerinckiaceae bacterium]|nr:hypothetical protein [Beijerinckiaceae bacterium]